MLGEGTSQKNNAHNDAMKFVTKEPRGKAYKKHNARNDENFSDVIHFGEGGTQKNNAHSTRKRTLAAGTQKTDFSKMRQILDFTKSPKGFIVVLWNRQFGN